MPEHPDVVRLRVEYAGRARRSELADRYSLFNPAELFAIQQRQRAILRCLGRSGLYPLNERRILELGCGSGGVLLEALTFGAAPRNLFGVDLLLDRLQMAGSRLSDLSLTCADGQSLPYASNRFDLTMQLTVFSSVLDDEVRRNLAREMLRVTRPGGMILWYDFWLNPTNPQTRGIRQAEIKRLFPGCGFEFHKITLAPPIARRLVPVSWGLALFLETLKVFNSHYLVTIMLQSG
jgi:ubiquinone/menaquinone biosynthesis C-methylase UbiE